MIGNLDKDQIEEVLNTGVLGRIGCHDDTRIYVVPVNYVYDGKSIICHSVTGMKIDIMRNNPKVCFEVEDISNATNWRTVIAWGEYAEIVDEKDRYDAMDLFVKKLLHLKISDTAKPPEISGMRMHPRSPGNIKPVVYKIIVTDKTGRYERH